MARLAVRMERPHLHPNICAKCRVGDGSGRDYFVDLGIDFDWEGVVFLCNKCLEDINKSTGEFFTKEELDNLLEIQAETVKAAKRIRNGYDGMSAWAFENFGIDLKALESKYNEFRRNGRTDATPDGSSGNSITTDSGDGKSSQSDWAAEIHPLSIKL